MRVLITGARAPVALELCRRFGSTGHQVFLADSLHAPLARFSCFNSGYFCTLSPRFSTEQFVASLVKITKEQKIDLLIPTCEEVFYISQNKELLSRFCTVFCDEFSLLNGLHSKWNYAQLVKDCGALTPQAVLLLEKNSWQELASSSEKLVFKTEFSRFASSTLVSPVQQVVDSLEINPSNPWVVQRRIFGKEYCSYSVAQQGVVTAHSCYHPKYKAAQGAGLYFEVVEHQKIFNFVKQFAAKHQFTGQIGFDFIQDQSGEVFVLECNPRATSGVHLFSTEQSLASAFESVDECLIAPSQIDGMKKNSMLGLPMLLFGASQALKDRNLVSFSRDFFAAQDVCFYSGDIKPSAAQLLSFTELVFRSFWKSSSFRSASTFDIEWNGGECRR